MAGRPSAAVVSAWRLANSRGWAGGREAGGAGEQSGRADGFSHLRAASRARRGTTRGRTGSLDTDGDEGEGRENPGGRDEHGEGGDGASEGWVRQERGFGGTRAEEGDGSSWWSGGKRAQRVSLLRRRRGAGTVAPSRPQEAAPGLTRMGCWSWLRGEGRARRLSGDRLPITLSRSADRARVGASPARPADQTRPAARRAPVLQAEGGTGRLQTAGRSRASEQGRSAGVVHRRRRRPASPRSASAGPSRLLGPFTPSLEVSATTSLTQTRRR